MKSKAGPTASARGAPFLAEGFRETLVWPHGRRRIHRLAVNRDLADTGFASFDSSFCIALSTDMIAKWRVRYADGQLASSRTRRVGARTST